MPKLRYGRPLWLQRAATPRRRFSLQRGTLTVDIAIVGGGITGAIAAYLFSEAGVSVAVLEARRVARGSTAASTALLMQEPDKDFSELAERYGKRAARSIWLALKSATHELSKTIRRLQIQCDLRERDSIYFTLKPQNVEQLRDEFHHRRGAGLPGRWLSRRRLHRIAGIRGEGGILTPGNAEIDPVKACLGFLRAARSRGAQIFESSPVRRTTATRTGVSLRTAHGVVHAKQVLVATGYATREFKPLVGRFKMKDTYVLATRRLPEPMRRQLLRRNTMLWDTDRPYHYFRWTMDGRLLVGGEDIDHRSRRNSAKQLAAGRARLLAYLADVYPALRSERPDYSWEGLFAETPDGLPYIGVHRRYPQHLFALGYGGNGMTASFLAAKLLLARYRKRPMPEESLFSFSRS